jgi:multidrug efflux pump subunit AcrB
MTVTELAVRRNRVTLVALLVILAGGISSFFGMSRSEDPGFIIRVATVVTYFPGASPERVEMLITDKIEKVVQEIPELDFISSDSKTGLSVVYVNIKEEHTRMRPIWDNLRRKIDGARDDLPPDAIGPFVNDEFEEVFGTVLTIVGEGYTYAELKRIADDVRDELLRIPEISKVAIHGAQEERVFIEYSNARLAELNLSAVQLQRILESRNIIIPGGSLEVGPERIALEPSGNFESVDDLRQAIIQIPGSRELVYLRDLVGVERGYVDPPEVRVRASGEPGLALAISLKEGKNITLLGEKVLDLKRRLEAVYPIGVEFDLAAFQPKIVNRKVDNFVKSLLQAVAIVLVVMILSLGIRTGLVVAALIPGAIVFALLIMGFVGIGLDQMSLASLIISLGLLVDNAIVMAESILVQIRGGKSAIAAAVESAAELRVPLLTSSLTTAAAFLPIFLAESSTGEYTAPLFKVVTITLLCSWTLAITMTPLLCVTFLKPRPDPGRDPFASGFYRAYRRGLVASLRHPVVSLLVIAGVFGVTLYFFRYVPKIFFPPDDAPFFSAEFRMPVGSNLGRTDEVVRRFEEYLSTHYGPGTDPERNCTNWTSFVGEGAPRYILVYSPEPRTPEYAYTIVNATDRAFIKEIIPDLERFCTESFPDLRVKILPKQLGPPVESPIQVRVSGKEPDVLFPLVERVRDIVREHPGTKNVTDDWGPQVKKLVVDVSEPRALRAGVTHQDVAVSLQTHLSGWESTRYREDDKVIPVVLRSIAADRQDLGKLEGMSIYSQATGRNVPLLQVADVRLEWEPSLVRRRDRLKTVTVEADVVRGGNALAVTADLMPLLSGESREWPFGYFHEFGGELESSGDANASIGAKLPIAFYLIVLLLITQFNSLRRSFIILMTIPLGLIGVVYGLLIANSVFGFMTLLGIISLAGIVINNAIVLIERIDLEIREHGLGPRRAIVEAAQRRLRPILLTTGTTVGGLLPLWIGGSPMFKPMAISIIFGLLFATCLTLGFVPLLYSLLFRIRFRGYEAEGSES